MKIDKPRSCLLQGLTVLAISGVALSFLMYLNTGSFRDAWVIAVIFLGLAAAILLVFWLPSLLYATGQYIGGRCAGMSLWSYESGPLTIQIDRQGIRRTFWSWRWPSRPACIMVPDLSRCQRQLLAVYAGGMVGSILAIVAYAFLAYWWSRWIEMLGVWFLVALIATPTLWFFREAYQISRKLHEVDGYADHYGVRCFLGYQEWKGVRPREWSSEALEILESPCEDNMFELEGIGKRFSYWNDKNFGGEEFRQVRNQLDEQLTRTDAVGIGRDGFVSMLAYYSATVERDAVAARSLLGEPLRTDDTPVTWRNAAVLAIYYVEGDSDKAEALARKMESSDINQEYLRDHVARIRSLSKS